MEQVGLSTILLNSFVQLINIAIFLFVFYKIFGKSIIAEVDKRKELLEKMEKAEQLYQEKINEAEREKKKIIEEALEHKNRIIQQAKQEAEKIHNQIVEMAEKKANDIILKAEIQAEQLKEELQNKWLEAVKNTVYSIFEKLVGEKKEVLDSYISKISKFKI